MNDKYKMFRNFMFNELSITKEDIKEWTKEAVAEQVQKLIGQMNIEQIAVGAAKNYIYGNWGTADVIRREIAIEIAKKIDISLLK